MKAETGELKMRMLVGVRNGVLAGIDQNGPQAQSSFKSPTQLSISEANWFNTFTDKFILRKGTIISNVIG